MFTPAPTVKLQLHLVPAGRRLDFPVVAGQYAYVYRRLNNQPWQCVAHNAHSPFIDHAALPVGTQADYEVRYCDTTGNVMRATPVVHVFMAQLPSEISVLGL